jgi:hypothetical protein
MQRSHSAEQTSSPTGGDSLTEAVSRTSRATTADQYRPFTDVDDIAELVAVAAARYLNRKRACECGGSWSICR